MNLTPEHRTYLTRWLNTHPNIGFSMYHNLIRHSPTTEILQSNIRDNLEGYKSWTKEFIAQGWELIEQIRLLELGHEVEDLTAINQI